MIRRKTEPSENLLTWFPFARASAVSAREATAEKHGQSEWKCGTSQEYKYDMISAAGAVEGQTRAAGTRRAEPSPRWECTQNMTRGLTRSEGGGGCDATNKLLCQGLKTKTAQQVFRINTTQTHSELCPFPERLELPQIIKDWVSGEVKTVLWGLEGKWFPSPNEMGNYAQFR